MAESSGTGRVYTDSNNRCLKCVFVVLEVFPKIMQKIMEHTGLPAKWLHNHIQNDQYFIRKLTQADHLVIQTLLSDGYTKLDLTLIFKIITHYQHMFINPPTRGWSTNPLPLEITIGDDAQRLRLKRNQFLHKVTIEFSEKDCDEFFTEVTAICERIDQFLKCTETESFERRVETLKKQPFIATEKLEVQYDEEKSLEEFYVTEVGNHKFKVFKAKSLKNFIKIMKDRHDHHNDSHSPITLTFPDMCNPELTKTMSDLREEINRGLVNINVEGISDGSLVIDIVVQTAVLLYDEELESELTTLITRLLTIRNYEDILNTLPVVTIVLSENLACFDDSPCEVVGDTVTVFSKGPLQLNLRVNSNILQSEERLKSEMNILFDTIVSKTNGNTVFPSDKPVVSVIEPGLKDDSQRSSIDAHLTQFDAGKMHNTPTIERIDLNKEAPVTVESINLQFLNKSEVWAGSIRSHCCSLPYGITVFIDEYGRRLSITKTDGTLQPIIELPLDEYGCGFTGITSTDESCVAVSSPILKVILIIDINKKEVVKGINIGYETRSITFKEGYILYCGHLRGIVKLDIDNGTECSEFLTPRRYQKKQNIDKDYFNYSEKRNYLHRHGKFPSFTGIEQIVYTDSSVRNNTTIASTNDRICYCHSTVTVLDSKYNVIYKCEKINMHVSDITIGHRDVIYISNLGNISAISPDCETVRQLLGKNDGLKKPFSVNYDRYTQQLIVIDHETVLRYSIKMM